MIKKINTACVPSKDLDQPGHLHNLRIVHEQALDTRLSREDFLVSADVQAELCSQLAHTPNCKLCTALDHLLFYLTHLSHMEFPIIINWTRSFSF